MSTSALTSATRSALGALVEKEERRVGSRTVAYEIVAQTTGTSSSWIRKFLAKSDEVKEPRITLFLNIRAAFENLCERAEVENRTDEVRLRALRGPLHAATESISAQSLAEDSNSV